MTIVEVNMHALRGNSLVPPQLVELISQGHWNAISQCIQEAYSESEGVACFLEILCCLVFAFPCIFLCHPLFAGLAAREKVSSALIRLNIAYFNGQPVLSTTRRDIISIDTSLIYRNQSGFIAIDGGISTPAIHIQRPDMQIAYAPLPQPQSMAYTSQPIYGVTQDNGGAAAVPSQHQSMAYISQPIYGVPQDNRGAAAVPVAMQVLPQSEFLVVVPKGTHSII